MQSICSRYINITDRQTDRPTDDLRYLSRGRNVIPVCKTGMQWINSVSYIILLVVLKNWRPKDKSKVGELRLLTTIGRHRWLLKTLACLQCCSLVWSVGVLILSCWHLSGITIGSCPSFRRRSSSSNYTTEETSASYAWPWLFLQSDRLNNSTSTVGLNIAIDRGQSDKKLSYRLETGRQQCISL